MYCTIAQVKAKNASLLHEEEDSRVLEKIEEAQGLVDGMLRPRYPVPLIFIPSEVRRITANIAASWLLSEVAGNSGNNNEPVQAQELYKQAMDQLKLIASGTMVLDIPEPSPPVMPSGANRQARSTTYCQKPYFYCWNPSDPGTCSR